MLRRLIYTSAVKGLQTPEMIGDILGAAGRHNHENGVTGILIAGGGCFFQVLEGEADVVEATFDRIRIDHRHGEALILWDEPVDARLFPDWAMRWRELTPDDPLAAHIQRVNRGNDILGAGINAEDPVNILLSAFLDSLGR
ncbi:MAG: BLUF domain-containing protein [Pikeienuella sp.]